VGKISSLQTRLEALL